jgi:pilus assembly protein CpaF
MYEYLLKDIIRSAISDAGIRPTKELSESLVNDLFGYVASLGPIEKYLDDPQISEIMVNGPNQIFIEKSGEMILTDTCYESNQQLRFAINHIINPMGRFVNSKRPLIDSRLPDGSRVNAVIQPVAPSWPCLTIRRFLKDKLAVQQLIDLGSLSPKIADFLAVCVKARLNMVIAGNTSSGKTTLLNILAGHIPDWERIVTIEDSAELNLHQTHKVSLEAQPADYRGEGQVTIRDLVRNALRMRPDRIIVGEVRGAESIDMLQAMNTGHEGSMTTVHSNSPRDSITRLETMALMAGFEMPVSAIRKQIASALHMIVYLNRMPDGSRRLTQISEVVGMEGEVVSMQELFRFDQSGIDKDHHPIGTFRSSGLPPRFKERLEAVGFKLDKSWFMN